MEIKNCGFTENNIYVAVLPNGKVLLANRDTQKVYEVNIVKVPKIKTPKGCKKVKIERFGNDK